MLNVRYDPINHNLLILWDELRQSLRKVELVVSSRQEGTSRRHEISRLH